MAILRKSEIKQMNEQALDNKLSDLRRELMLVNAQISAGTVPENPGRVKEIKKTIARILTQKQKLNINVKQEVKKLKA